jgi:hypothetical protein
MAAGGHLDFDNDHSVSRIKGNSTMSKMTPAAKMADFSDVA